MMILVMNAGGNIGRELVKELALRSAKFKAGFRSANQAEAAKNTGIDVVLMDYAQPASIQAALEGVEKVFVVAPPVQNLVELEGHVVGAAKKARLKHLVKLSVWEADKAEFSFAKQHQAAEQQIIHAEIPYTFLRPTGFMQNMLGNAQSIKNQSAYYIPAGDAKVSEIDIRDIARVAAVALTEEGHIGKSYKLSGPEAMTHTDRAKILSDALGRIIRYVSPPEPDWKLTMLGYGLPEWQVDGIIDLLHYYSEGKSEEITDDVERVTGVKPTNYRQFVEDNIAAFR